MRHLIVAALAVLIGAGPAARGEALDDLWAGIHWGESDPALLQHFAARATVLSRTIDFGDAYTQLVLRRYELGGVGLIVFYQIDKTTRGLKRIQLERPRHAVNPSAFRGVLSALDAAYGAPDVHCGASPGPANGFQGTSEYVWRRSGMVIRTIFRDTTLEAFGGCYSPACGLIGQLLVRISPPQNDDGQCPVPHIPPRR